LYFKLFAFTVYQLNSFV